MTKCVFELEVELEPAECKKKIRETLVQYLA